MLLGDEIDARRIDGQRAIDTDRRMKNRGDGGGQGVLVLGAGVCGLTSALCLRRQGFEVTVVADRFAPRVTSVVAGALWEWPPAVCGHQYDPISICRSKAWCEASYQIFADLAADPATGVYLRPVTFYFERPIEEVAPAREKMAELAGKVRRFMHDPTAIKANGINPELGLRDAYSHLAPMIDTDRYMDWLLGEVRRAGCRIIERKLAGSLREHAEELEREYAVDAIVNCTGLGAAELAGDIIQPLRGALIRVRNDGRRMPRITEAHCVSHNGSSQERGFIFIVPRGEDMLVLGGLAEPDEWGLDIGLSNYEPIRAMHRRCIEFMPVLKNAAIDAAEPVRVGLRPFRSRNVRLEREEGTRIVHNYGHGGSGVSLSWGCALEVVEKVEHVLCAASVR
jgi:D-amino-acid oxidase